MQSGPISQKEWMEMYDIKHAFRMLGRIDRMIDKINVKDDCRKEFIVIFKDLANFYNEIERRLPKSLEDFPAKGKSTLSTYCENLNILLNNESIQKFKYIYSHLRDVAKKVCEELEGQKKWNPLSLSIGLTYLKYFMDYYQDCFPQYDSINLSYEEYVFIKLSGIARKFLSKAEKKFVDCLFVDNQKGIFSLKLKRDDLVKVYLEKVRKQEQEAPPQSEEDKDKLEMLKIMIRITPKLTLDEITSLEQQALSRVVGVVEAMDSFSNAAIALCVTNKKNKSVKKEITYLVGFNLSCQKQNEYINGLLTRIHRGPGTIYPRELKNLLFSLKKAIKHSVNEIPRHQDVKCAIEEYLWPVAPLGVLLDNTFIDQFRYFAEVIALPDAAQMSVVKDEENFEWVSSMNAMKLT